MRSTEENYPRAGPTSGSRKRKGKWGGYNREGGVWTCVTPVQRDLRRLSKKNYSRKLKKFSFSERCD